jgi:hypothetical protein
VAALTEEQKAFVVRELACYRSPQEVADLVNQEFGIAVTREQMRNYHPESAHNSQASKVAEKWRVLFETTRAAFKTGAADEALTIKAYRARELGELYRRAKKKNLLPLAADLLGKAELWFGGGGGGEVDEGAASSPGETPEQAERYLSQAIGAENVRAARPKAPFGRR